MGLHHRSTETRRPPATNGRPQHDAAPSTNSSAGIRGIGNVEDEAIAASGPSDALARIAALPPDQADVVLLRVIGDLSVAAVAEILDKRPGAVRALQHRALRNLAKDVSDQGVTE